MAFTSFSVNPYLGVHVQRMREGVFLKKQKISTSEASTVILIKNTFYVIELFLTMHQQQKIYKKIDTIKDSRY